MLTIVPIIQIYVVRCNFTEAALDIECVQLGLAGNLYGFRRSGKPLVFRLLSESERARPTRKRTHRVGDVRLRS